jgi:hypothetical protein
MNLFLLMAFVPAQPSGLLIPAEAPVTNALSVPADL